MSDLQGILSKAEKIVDLTQLRDALEQFEAMKARWADIRDELEQLQQPMTYEEWARKVFEGVESSQVADVLGNVGLEDVHSKLSGWLGQVEQEERDTLYLLLRPINGEFPDGNDTLQLPLFALDESVSNGPDSPWSLSLKANSSLEVEAVSNWPYESEEIDQDLLTLRLSLDGSADAKAKLPAQFASISAGASTEQSFKLACYYDYSSFHLPFVAATAGALDDLINPFEFNSVWSHLSSANSRAFGATFDYEGSVQIGIELAIATVFEDAALDAAPTLKLEASVKRPVSASLSLRRGRPIADGHSVLFTLSRKKSTVRRFAATGGLTIDLSKSASKLHAVLTQRLDKWEKGFEEIKPYLSPGTFLRDQLSDEVKNVIGELVGDQSLAKALESDASIALGLKAGEKSEVSKWLGTLLTDKIDSFAGDYLSGREEAVSNILDQVLNELPVVSILGEDANAKLEDAVKGLLDKVLNKLRGKVRSIYNDAKDDAQALVELGDELGRIGASTNDAVASLDNLTKGVSEVIESHFKRFRALVAKLEDATKTTLTAEIDIEDVLESGVNFEFAGEFTKRTAEAAALYHSLMAGGYQEVERQIFAGARVDGFSLDGARTKLGRFTRREREWGFKVSFAGVSIGGRETLKASVETVTFADGRLELDAQGLASRTLTKRGDKRSFNFLSDVSLLHARKTAQRDAQRLFEEMLSFQMIYDEDHLERDEVTAFLHDLSRTPFLPTDDASIPTLLDPQAQVLALARVDDWIANPGGRAKLSGEMELRLMFGTDAIVKQLSQKQHEDVDLFDMMMRQFERNGAFTASEWAEFLDDAGRDFNREEKDQLASPAQTRDYKILFEKKITRRHGVKRPGPRRNSRPAVRAFAHERVRQMVRRAKALPEFLDASRKIFNAPVGANGEFDRNAVRRHVMAKDEAIMKIIRLGGGRADSLADIDNITRFTDGIAGRTLTFLQMLNFIFEADAPRLVVVFKSTQGDKVIDQFVVA
ncbi:hypothetical protein INR77_04205 [Erythrobacter sp. SCSIO 43205]|uniref:hypothetical protein n=1 Tax=Erythrobacter sp. SCSIO 43205 TaxID=2779361 RepID=UPI001CA8D4DD|nr:hypothetical protein [Erythrobacter sp. SCSIO 43205]UAB78910.1 hypothetical protein INR77_04205 [Erythrobacter sp. SCSIO 43205]